MAQTKLPIRLIIGDFMDVDVAMFIFCQIPILILNYLRNLTITKEKTKSKKTIIHLDKIHNELAVGDFVIIPIHNSLDIRHIVAITPKMVRVAKITKSSYHNSSLKYPTDCVKIDGPALSAYLLRR